MELYRKRIHAHNTHTTWWEWSVDRRWKAWQAHCLGMLEQALQIDAAPQDHCLLWAAIIERLVSPKTAEFFLPISELTATERTNRLTLFLELARTSPINIPGALDAAWDEIDRWTKDFYWAGSKTNMLANPG